MILGQVAVSVVALFAQGQDTSRALQMLQKLGVVQKGQSVTIRRDDLRAPGSIGEAFVSGEFTITLRADGSLFAFTWRASEEVRSERREIAHRLRDEQVLAEAKKYVHRVWPSQQFKFFKPTPGSDPDTPSKFVGFCPVLNGLVTDEAYLGFIEIDTVGGELRFLRSSNVPAAPSDLRPRIGREEAEAMIISRLATEATCQFIRPWSRCELRISPIETPVYGEAGKLAYRFYADEFSLKRSGGAGYYGRLFMVRIDATTGAVMQNAAAGVGGRAPFDLPVPRIEKERFNSLVFSSGRLTKLRGSAIARLIPAPLGPSSEKPLRVGLIGKQTILFPTYDPASQKIYFRLDGNWYEAVPDPQLRKALASS